MCRRHRRTTDRVRFAGDRFFRPLQCRQIVAAQPAAFPQSARPRQLCAGQDCDGQLFSVGRLPLCRSAGLWLCQGQPQRKAALGGADGALFLHRPRSAAGGAADRYASPHERTGCADAFVSAAKRHPLRGSADQMRQTEQNRACGHDAAALRTDHRLRRHPRRPARLLIGKEGKRI